MGGALKRGMVLSMSIWDDDFGRMLWLDAEKSKLEEDPADPGVRRGPCSFDFGTDKDCVSVCPGRGGGGQTGRRGGRGRGGRNLLVLTDRQEELYLA